MRKCCGLFLVPSDLESHVTADVVAVRGNAVVELIETHCEEVDFPLSTSHEIVTALVDWFWCERGYHLSSTEEIYKVIPAVILDALRESGVEIIAGIGNRGAKRLGGTNLTDNDLRQFCEMYGFSWDLVGNLVRQSVDIINRSLRVLRESTKVRALLLLAFPD